MKAAWFMGTSLLRCSGMSWTVLRSTYCVRLCRHILLEQCCDTFGSKEALCVTVNSALADPADDLSQVLLRACEKSLTEASGILAKTGISASQPYDHGSIWPFFCLKTYNRFGSLMTYSVPSGPSAIPSACCTSRSKLLPRLSNDSVLMG